MYEEIVSALNSIEFVNSLAKFKKAYIKDLVFEVDDLITVQDALIIRNILLLLHSAHKLDSITTKPINIAGWVKIYKYDDVYGTDDDAIDALSYFLGMKETKSKKQSKSIKTIDNRKVDIQDINLALDIKDTIDIFADYCEPQQKNSKIPVTFKEDMKKYSYKELALMYNKSTSTIRRWMNELSK